MLKFLLDLLKVMVRENIRIVKSLLEGMDGWGQTQYNLMSNWILLGYVANLNFEVCCKIQILMIRIAS